MKTKKYFLPVLFLCAVLTGCGISETAEKSPDVTDHTVTGYMELEFAEQFSVGHCSDGCSVIEINNEKFLFVPEENKEKCSNSDMTVINEQNKNIYLAASSAMDLFDGIKILDCVGFTSTSANSWSLENIKKAVSDEDIFYVGKYSAPDYEFLLSEGCSLAIESTMINHTPAVKEQLIRLGIPVLTERSSYESHPMGRLEWIKLYGLITGNEDKADAFFSEKLEMFNNVSENISHDEENKKTAVFFYITSGGYVNVRKPGDYVSKMIELAGGKYIFTNEDLKTDENELSTMNMQLEDFYQKAKDADIIIYNSTIDGAIETKEQLISVSSLFSDFKAVKENNVWCTGQNMFQQTGSAAEMISDMYRMFSDDKGDGEYEFLTHLE